MKGALVYVLLFATLYPTVVAQTLNVIGSLAFTPQFSGFYNLSGPIRNELSSPGPITVFAPTNLAVQQFVNSLPAGFNNPSLVRRILLYHVAPGYILLENITSANPIVSLNGAVLNTSLVGTSVAVDTYAVILSQFPQVNGNIFTVNRVLIPPGISFVAQSLFSSAPTSAPVPTSAVPTSAPVPTSEAPTSAPPSSEPTSAPPIQTSQETLTPAPPQFTGICTSQACCTARAFPNTVTGDGYLEFNPICNDGGLHCDDDTGCLICHDPAILLNIFNRPLCNVTTVQPYTPCTDQACCTAKMTPNAETGYGYLEFVSGCTEGGFNCFDETGCIDCFNPLPGAVNSLNRPVCSPEAIRSFGFVPLVSMETVPAKRALLEVEQSTAPLALPAIFGVFLAAVAFV